VIKYIVAGHATADNMAHARRGQKTFTV